MTGALVCSRISVKAFLFMEGPMSVAVVIVHGLEHGAQQNLPNDAGSLILAITVLQTPKFFVLCACFMVILRRGSAV